MVHGHPDIAMKAARLFKRWQGTLRACLRTIRVFRRRKQPDEAEVHALRVALRRARLLADLGRPILKRAPQRKLRRQARRALDALGPVRDADITLAWLTKTRAPRELRQSVQQRRQTGWQTARQTLRKPLPRLHLPDKHQRGAAARLTERWQCSLRVAETDARDLQLRPDRLTLARRHDLRRRIRRWRYLLELAARHHHHESTGLIKRLLAAQDAMGAAQNAAAMRALLSQLGQRSATVRWTARSRREEHRAHRSAQRALRRLFCPR
jgi:CHAD domain-containing protein